MHYVCAMKNCNQNVPLGFAVVDRSAHKHSDTGCYDGGKQVCSTIECDLRYWLYRPPVPNIVFVCLRQTTKRKPGIEWNEMGEGIELNA